jgi:hypothetical protein
MGLAAIWATFVMSATYKTINISVKINTNY